MTLTAEEYVELMGGVAPEPFAKWYLRAISALKLICSELDEENEIVKQAIAFQIDHMYMFDDSMVAVGSFSIGKFSDSGASEKVSQYSQDALNLLISNKICSLWIGGAECGCH